MKVHNDTAILLFSESVDTLSKKKVLNTSREKNFKLLKGLTERSFHVAKKSGIPLILIDEKQQQGKTFGEKLANAIQYVLNLGYQKVITIGNDCPDLNAKDLIDTCIQLDRHDLVVGPDLRGGTYLLGINKGSFDAAHFENLDWQNITLRSSLVNYTKRLHLTIHWLKEKADFNVEEEIKRFWQSSSVMRQLVSSLTNTIRVFDFPLRPTYRGAQVTFLSRRGPPTR